MREHEARRQYTARERFLPIRSVLPNAASRRPGLLGVNWYLNDYVKLMFNYTESDLSQYPTTTVTANTSGVPTGTELKGFDERQDQRLRHARPCRLVRLYW